MSRAEHTYTLDDLSVQLIVPDGVVAPRWVEVKRDDVVLRLRHAGVRNLRAPVKRKPRQASPLSKLPEGWAPPDHEVEQARTKAPSVNVEVETDLFVQWAASKGEARADWLAAWRGWMLRTHKANVERGWKPRRVMSGESSMVRWCREHGVTPDEYEAKRGEPGWLEMIKRRGRVA